MTEQRSIADAKETVQEAVGNEGLVGLVNNAGVGGGGPIEFIPLDSFRETLEVNLVGQIAVTQAFMQLIRQAKGTVVFIASIGGRVASPFLSPYNASKFAIEALGESLRGEVKPWGIDVTVVEPGSIDTQIWAKGADTAAEQIEGLSHDARRLYGKQLARFGEVLTETADRGIHPDKVADVDPQGDQLGQAPPSLSGGHRRQDRRPPQGDAAGSHLLASSPRRQTKMPTDVPAK